MKPTESAQNGRLPEIPSDRGDDLHNLEIAEDADLVLFMAGNQFMVMPELLEAFRKQCPEVRRIFHETLPPGLELKQILAGGARFGDRVIHVRPDVYTSVNVKAMETLAEKGHVLEGDFRMYLRNRLSLMVPRGNPAGIRTVSDMGGDHVRISQPDPENEDIAFHVMDMYRDAGGEELVRRIMEEKRADGTAVFTVVHHRETPLRIAEKTADVGPVWATEIVAARAAGFDIESVDPGPGLDQRQRINYYACRLKKAPHPENAEKFMAFIMSAEAAAIYGKYGFVPA